VALFQTPINPNDVTINPEYAKMVPKHSKEKFEELKQSIQEIGLYEPIVINSKYVVLDGHHRMRACQEANVVPRFRMMDFKTEDLERLYVMETNLYRRQLTVFQEVELRTEITKLKSRQGQRTDLTSSSFEEEVIGTHRKIASEMPNASNSTVERALYVLNNAKGEEGEKIKEAARLGTNKGGISIFNAYKQTKQLTETPKEPIPLPEGKYSVIYADPPWTYTHSFLAGAPNTHYTTMTTEKICELDIPSHKDAVLFLWSTNPLLEDAFKVIEAWGFQYKTNIAWVKDRTGTGHYVRGQHELLLICTKGNIGTPPTEARVPSVLIAPRTEHSKKPHEVYDIIEAMYPNGKRLELFSRNNRENWTMWGAES